PYTVLYPLSLHDALPIWPLGLPGVVAQACPRSGQPSRAALRTARWMWRSASALRSQQLRQLVVALRGAVLHTRPEHRVADLLRRDRKSTRLNSSHVSISY